MNSEKFKVNWKSFSDHVSDMMVEMMRSSDLTDVTLVTDDKKQFRAHKFVLNSCSPVFRSIIASSHGKDANIYLRGIQHEEISSLLEFMYTGKASVTHERINEFLNVAKNLEIKELSAGVQTFNNSNLPKFEEERNVGNDIMDTFMLPVAEVKENRKVLEYFSNGEKPTKGGPIYIEDKRQEPKMKQKMSPEIEYKSHNSIPEEQSLKCKECSKEFSNKEILTKHFAAIHKGEKYQCNLCERTFSTKSNIESHIKTVHERSKFPCPQCQKQFSNKKYLKTHIHFEHETVNTNYDCDLCDVMFSDAAGLNQHNTDVHGSIFQ